MNRMPHLHGLAAVVLLSAFVSGCGGPGTDPTPQTQAAEGENAEHRDPFGVVGAWEMVEFSSTSNGETTVQKADPEPLAITVYTPNRFAFVWRGASLSGGGSYVYDGQVVTQTFDYVGDPTLEGSVWTFDMTVNGDTIVFEGPTKVISGTGEEVTTSFPHMREVRTRIDES